MTQQQTDPTPSTAWTPRTESALAGQQLEAIEAFTRARKVAEEAELAGARTREMRMDTARRMEVLRREHEALVARAHGQLEKSGDVLRASADRRVVLAHRNEWFVTKVGGLLTQQGMHVVAHTDNGADAVGLVVAEQPDLVLVEDTLAMVPGEQVVQEVRTWCPGTVVAAQVAYGDRVAALLAAGATSVFTRQVPPAEVAQTLAGLLVA